MEEWLRLQANNGVDVREKNKLIELVCKIEDEEKRYAKTYGAGTLEFEAFRDLIEETKKKKLIYKKQLDELSKKQSQEAINLLPEDVINEVKKVLKSIDLSNKIAVIKDIIDKVIIQERSGVEVWAHLPLPNIQKLGYEPIGWYFQHTIATLQFKFNFVLPAPNKERIIVQRDGKGRIIRSQIPVI